MPPPTSARAPARFSAAVRQRDGIDSPLPGSADDDGVLPENIDLTIYMAMKRGYDRRPFPTRRRTADPASYPCASIAISPR
jgi:hypothetical protein